VGEARSLEILPVTVNPDDPLPAARPKAALGANPPRIGFAGGGTLLELLRETEGPLRVGSNNWVTSGALSASGKPVLANDPHLDARILPGPWYPTGLITPQGRAIGATIPGLPGMVVGRTERIAVGVTNAYGDAQDLYLETVDPADPGRYLEGLKSIPFEVLRETLRIKDGKAPGGFREESVTIRLTRRGPVITDILPGLKSRRVMPSAGRPSGHDPSSVWIGF
jgi:penicillin amidase